MVEGLGGPVGWAAEAAYRFASGVRAALYDRGVLPVHRLPVPVVSVGNLLVGGTGKTPICIELAGRLAEGERKVALLSRGYGRDHPRRMVVLDPATGGAEEDARSIGDEPALFRLRLPGVPVVLSGDRVAGGEEAVKRFRPDLVILDDGMQHRRIGRDVDLVLLPGVRPFGNGFLLPRGPLRERPEAIARADRILINTTEGEEEGVSERLDRLGATANRTRFHYEPSALLSPGGAAAETASLRNEKVLAVSAIGNPCSFERTLSSLGAKIEGAVRFRDHHRFTGDDCEKIATEAERLGAIPVTTEKDRVRFPAGAVEAGKIYTLRIEVVFEEGGKWIDELATLKKGS